MTDANFVEVCHAHRRIFMHAYHHGAHIIVCEQVAFAAHQQGFFVLA
jgi:hypothetical protein